MLADRKKINYNNLNSNKYNNKKEDKNENNILQKKHLCLYVMAIIILGLIFVFLINQTLIINEMNFKVNSLENELKEIKSENEDLNVQIAQKKSLSQIENIARDELGMIDPQKTKTMVMNEKGVKSTEISDNELMERKKFSDLLKDFWQTINVVKADEFLE